MIAFVFIQFSSKFTVFFLPNIKQAPVESGPWKGTLNATTYAAACIQTSGNYSSLVQSEDCLFLNVFVPNDEVCDCKTHDIPVTR